jgi:Tfp pilus assembly protein PilO
MRFGKRDKLALILASIAVAVFVTFQFAIFPVWDSVQESRANLPIEEKKLDKHRAMSLTLGLRSSEATNVEARLRQSESGLLSSKTPALASAEMQQIAMDSVAAQQLELRSMEFAPVKNLSTDYAQVPISLQFSGRIDQVASFLRDIESNSKYLTVPKLLMQLPGAGAKPKTLIVSVTIAGVMRADGNQRAASGAGNK